MMAIIGAHRWHCHYLIRCRMGSLAHAASKLDAQLTSLVVQAYRRSGLDDYVCSVRK